MAVSEEVGVARTGATVGEKVKCVQRFLNGLRVHRIFTNLRGTTPYVLVPIREASSGNYKVSLNVSTKVTGSVALFVNGATSGLITLTPDINNTVTVSSKVPVALPAGLSVLRLDTPQGSGDIFVKDVVVE